MGHNNYIVKISFSKDSKHKLVEKNEANTLKMLDYFQQEWLYRHQHFWTISIKLFLFNLVVIMLPFISGAFGITFDLQKIPSLIFPLIGISLAIACYLLTKGEAKRLDEVAGVKYKINKHMDKIYQYKKYKETNSNKTKLVNLIPIGILVFQIILAICEMFFLLFVIHI